MQQYFWVCAECGWKSEDSVARCPHCGNRIWGKALRVEDKALEHERALSEARHTSRSVESIGQYLDLVSGLFNSIECGTCNSVIYSPDGKFDRDVLTANTAKHYSESPNCKQPLPKASGPTQDNRDHVG